MWRRVIFNGTVLPLLLLAPQLAVTAVFFLWPAGVAVYQSVLQQDAWGLRTEFVGLRNFAEVLADPSWRAAAWNTVVFSAAVAGLAMGIALVLAVQADKSVRGARAYRTLLIWPYAVAPAVAAVSSRSGTSKSTGMSFTGEAPVGLMSVVGAAGL